MILQSKMDKNCMSSSIDTERAVNKNKQFCLLWVFLKKKKGLTIGDNKLGKIFLRKSL